MEYEIQLFDAVENSHLKLVSDARIYELTPAEQEKLLLVKYGVNVQPEETLSLIHISTKGNPRDRTVVYAPDVSFAPMYKSEVEHQCENRNHQRDGNEDD